MTTALLFGIAALLVLATPIVALGAWLAIGLAWAGAFASMFLAAAIFCAALASAFTAKGCR